MIFDYHYEAGDEHGDEQSADQHPALPEMQCACRDVSAPVSRMPAVIFMRPSTISFFILLLD